VVIIIVVVVIIVVIVIIIVVIIIVIIVIVMAASARTRAVIDDYHRAIAAHSRNPEVAKDLARAGIQDDLSRPVLAVCDNADPAQKRPLLNHRPEALPLQLSNDAVRNLVGQGWPGRSKPDCESSKELSSFHLMSHSAFRPICGTAKAPAIPGPFRAATAGQSSLLPPP
jgi:hypothetical protein